MDRSQPSTTTSSYRSPLRQPWLGALGGLLLIALAAMPVQAQANLPSATPPSMSTPESPDPSEPVPDQQPAEEPQPEPETPPASDTQPAQQTIVGDEEDELFERVFGQPRTPGVQRVVVPFLINDQPQDQVLVLLSPEGSATLRWQAAPFLAQTEQIVRPDIQANLEAAVDSKGNLSLEALQDNGLDATFDERSLELLVQVPPEQRRTNVFNLQNRGLPPEAADALRPSAVSAYVNLRGGQDWIWEDDLAAALGRQPLRLNLDGAFNVKGWVLEGRANFIEGGNPAWVRGDVRLVRDLPDQAIRIVAGDLSIPITGYQNSQAMGGIIVARNFSLQPYLVTRPISNFEFFLESPARVEIFINGRLDQTLQLPAGPQDIRDLALRSGANDIELVITDDVGRVQRLNFSSAIASELLAPGLQQFAYSLGFPSTTGSGDRSYDLGQPTLTASHRWGLSETLTAGPYFQANPEQQLLGVEGTWATSLGNFGWDAALSHGNDAGTDSALRLRYRFTRLGEDNSSQRALGLELERRGSNFITPGDDLPSNDVAYQLTANYSQRLFWDIFSSLNLRYQLGRNDRRDTYSLGLRLSKTLSRGLGVSLNLSQAQDTTGKNEQRVSLNLFRTLPRQRQSIRTSTEITSTGRPTNALTWNSSSRRRVGGTRTTFVAAQNEESYDLSARLLRTGYRLNLDFAHDTRLPSTEDTTTRQITRLNLGTALVFAGGRFGWSRPIDNSFALLAPNSALRGQVIGVNPSFSGYSARIDRLGPAVVPDLNPYRVTKLQMDAPELPIGYDLGDQVHNLLPTYRSGTLIRVGTDATVFLRGVLRYANSEPVALQTGEITSLSDPDWQSVTLFTNRTGKFALEGFGPGRYRLRLFTDPPAFAEFEVPEDKVGLHDVGTLTVHSENSQ